jgi:hypothetical protein
VIQIEKFARNLAASAGEFLDHHTSKYVILVSPMIPKFAPGSGREFRRTSESGHW